MQRLGIIFIISLILISSDLCMGQGGGIDLYNVSTAKLAKENTINFKVKTSYQNLSREILTVSTVGDTFNLVGGSNLGDFEWSLRYGLRRWAEVSVTGITYFDINQSSYKYGSGDTKIGLKIGTGRPDAGIDMAFDAYYTFSTGFSEGTRLIRRFSADKNTWGGNVFFDFNFDRFSIKVNGGYDNNGGKAVSLPGAYTAFWYPVISGTLGLTEQGEILRSNQYNFGFGGDIRLFNRLRFFGEYKSNRITSKESGSINLGTSFFGLTFGNREKLTAKVGYLLPFGDNQTDSGLMFSLRFNGLFSERRRERELPVPVISEEQPATIPGRKPFFSRQGVYFSGARKPVLDTVFLIDISPSMIGRGLLDDVGSNVLTDLPNFINTLIDSTLSGSNIAIVIFGNEVTSLTWSDISEEKKSEIKRALNDVPDNAREFAQSVENSEIEGTVEDFIGGVDKTYEILDDFKRADYNRMHLQRIILFTDDIRDDSTEDVNIESKLLSLVRKYDINRKDFKYFYYLLTNRETAKRLKEYIINFVEKEDGSIFREVNFAQKEELLPRLNYNQIEYESIFKYLSQITSIGVVSFRTNDKFSIGKQLTESFKSVFDYNEYFKITNQVGVDRAVENIGLNVSDKIEITEAQRVGKELGVDYIATGEVIDFQINRESGFYIPRVIGFPKTEMSLNVAINLIDVSDGSLVFVEIIPAKYSFRRGMSFLPSTREDKTRYLSTLEKDVLQNQLLQKWADNLKGRMFEDITVIRPPFP